jgi:hypothetical protein
MEIWRDIEGFEDLYQISNEGRVKSLGNNKSRKEKMLKGVKNSNGYLGVGLYKNGKLVRKYVHRLVAEAFIPNPNHYKEVNHKDENKQNNHVDNLEWCSSKYNANYGTRNQKSSEKRSKRVDQIDAVTGEVVRQWESTNECGRNGYNQGHVAACARGELKTFKGYVWKYLQA